jgi:hypothetical protein
LPGDNANEAADETARKFLRDIFSRTQARDLLFTAFLTSKVLEISSDLD